MALGAQATLFGLQSFFPQSAIRLFPLRTPVYGRNGEDYWGWPLPRLWLHDKGVTIILQWLLSNSRTYQEVGNSEDPGGCSPWPSIFSEDAPKTTPRLTTP